MLLIAAHKTPSLVPRPTSPFIFHFALTIVHGSRREAKNGEGQGALREWHQVDWGGHGGAGPIVNSACPGSVHHLSRLGLSTSPDSRHCKQLRLTILNLLATGPHPPTSTQCYLHDEFSQAISVFHCSSASLCYYQGKMKSGVGQGMRLQNSFAWIWNARLCGMGNIWH